MKITKKELFKFCDDNNDAINELQSQSDNTDFLLAVLIQQLKDSGVIDEISPETKPQPKQLDQSVFNGLDEKWRFAAVDLDGESWVYREQPKIDKGDDRWLASNTPPNSIGTGYDTSNWQYSLIERESKELTGSDLARAMLARGDRWILCGNTTDGFASPCIIDGYRCSEDDLGFVLTNGKSIEPRYIYPVNNQGEPLTASEVGL